MNVIVRKARQEDLSEVENLVRQYWPPHLNYSDELENNETLFLVAEFPDPSERSGVIAGVTIMWIKAWNRTGYLIELAVDSEHMRQGIGKMLVEELCIKSREAGLRSIIVETQPSEKDAMDFYLSNNFRLCGFNDRYYTNTPKTSKDIAIFLSIDL